MSTSKLGVHFTQRRRLLEEQKFKITSNMYTIAVDLKLMIQRSYVLFWSFSATNFCA